MPEDIKDKLIDFGMMLNSVCTNEATTPQEKKRLNCYFTDLCDELLNILNSNN